jgi:hypothetical protein
LASGEDVEVQVRHRFSSVGSVIDHDPEARIRKTFLFRNVADPGHEMAEEVLICGLRFPDPDHEFLGHKQEMNGGLRPDVAEAEALLVFVNNLAGDLAIGDFLENGFLGHEWIDGSIWDE